MEGSFCDDLWSAQFMNNIILAGVSMTLLRKLPFAADWVRNVCVSQGTFSVTQKLCKFSHIRTTRAREREREDQSKCKSFRFMAMSFTSFRTFAIIFELFYMRVIVTILPHVAYRSQSLDDVKMIGIFRFLNFVTCLWCFTITGIALGIVYMTDWVNGK